MIPATELLAIRHAPVAVEGICYGSTNVPTKLDAAEVVARIEGAVARFAPHTIWSSNALRCREPAAMLSERLGIPHRVDPGVYELSYGEWEGLAWDALPKAELDEWMAAWRTKSPPGGETITDFGVRVAAWWQSLDPGRHFLMAHAGVVHCLDVAADGLSWEETGKQRLDFLQPKRFTRDHRAG